MSKYNGWPRGDPLLNKLAEIVEMHPAVIYYNAKCLRSVQHDGEGLKGK